MWSGAVSPFMSCTSFGSLMIVLARVPSTTYPGKTHAFFLSEHHISNNCLDNPLCSPPGLAITTDGPTSVKSSMLFNGDICLNLKGFEFAN
ncbi:hypothetical protein OIU77_001846 [Salix suchowensis]|uniref:Secreted protein n=3 Tax=Salix TaxID=40685 RepID=A0A9Q0PN91_9ROSI|nr:hypothetical protein OIU77_001846 [Salix suchowensis]KAJ6421731.1 hypothetical protein OIU84_029005 [Salix udensis]KAJ6691321.1 hypothetical protein OIU74_015923 [Salix koriyanagi]